ncbi:hypothetical protein KQX54_000182 [Cotesia glomerata]|uniref:Uncharacterized protein n=1 Tax=Cotesia glomerata TaxID=32391 RepID=A0AAV7ITA0_COTGL|nr:hypothetical protein KQX54_000182 [Cotesia glomerata]
MEKITDDTGELYTRGRSNKFYESDFKKTNLSASEIDEVISRLGYLRFNYKCKYGPSTKTSDNEEKKQQRNTSTFNHGCPSFIRFYRVRKDGEYVLKVFEANSNHLNHPANSKELVNALPERRRLPPELKKDVIEYIKLKSKHKMIKNKIREENGILLTCKDVSNIAQAKRNRGGNN